MSGGGRAILILTFIVIIGAVLFFVRSGAVSDIRFFVSGLVRHPSSSAPSVFAPQGKTSSTQSVSPYVPWYKRPSAPVAQSSPTVPWYKQSQATGTSSISKSSIPQGYTIDQLSPYFHNVQFGSVSVGQISLRANLNGSSTVNITGWMIKAKYGSELVPQAIGLYDPSGLAAENDIILRRGDYVNIYSSASAIGKNLRLNKCTGYLENYNHFTPSLPKNCPSINKSDISGFSGKCQNYISTLYGCRLPASNPPVPQNDYGCIAYLNTINLKGCYDRHIGDSDFLSHEWRVWTSYRFLDQYHDQVLLLDRQGLLVDLHTY